MKRHKFEGQHKQQAIFKMSHERIKKKKKKVEKANSQQQHLPELQNHHHHLQVNFFKLLKLADKKLMNGPKKIRTTDPTTQGICIR